MIIDLRKDISQAFAYEKVLVDGCEIKLVWYADTDAGFVRTYDVLGDAKIHRTREPLDPEVIAEARAGQKEFWDMPLDGVMSKTVRGVVTLLPAQRAHESKDQPAPDAEGSANVKSHE